MLITYLIKNKKLFLHHHFKTKLMYDKQIQLITQLAGGINEHAMRELMQLLRLAELNGIEQGIRTAKELLTKQN